MTLKGCHCFLPSSASFTQGFLAVSEKCQSCNLFRVLFLCFLCLVCSLSDVSLTGPHAGFAQMSPTHFPGWLTYSSKHHPSLALLAIMLFLLSQWHLHHLTFCLFPQWCVILAVSSALLKMCFLKPGKWNSMAVSRMICLMNKWIIHNSQTSCLT